MDIKHELTTIGCYLLAAFAGALIGWGLAEDLMVVLDVMEVSGNVETAFLLAGALVFVRRALEL